MKYTEFVKKLKEGTYTEHYPIKGDKNIVTLNYCTIKHQEFKNQYLVECRGITFNKKTEKILSRGIHKFFNVGENTLSSEKMYLNLKNNEERIILEKIDGTMVIPFIYKNTLHFKTKRVLFGEFLLTIVSTKKEAKKLENKLLSKNVRELSRELLTNNMVPIFEYIGPNNKICVDYDKEKMIVVAIRRLDDGIYVDRKFVERVCKEFCVECIKIFSTDPNDIQRNFEGVVEFFPKQQIFFKSKTDWYRKTHLLKSFRSLEEKQKFFVGKILKQKIDDYKPFLSKKEHLMVMKFEKLISETVDKIMKGLKEYVGKHRNLKNIELASMIKNKYVKNTVFKIKNNVKFNTLGLYRYKEEFLDLIKKNTMK